MVAKLFGSFFVLGCMLCLKANSMDMNIAPFQQIPWAERSYLVSLPHPFKEISIKVISDGDTTKEVSLILNGENWLLDVDKYGPLDSLTEPDVVFTPAVSKTASSTITLGFEYGVPKPTKSLEDGSTRYFRSALLIVINDKNQYQVKVIEKR